MSDVKAILDSLAAYDATPESRGIDLRLDLAAIIVSQLKQKGWSQKKLSKKAGFKEAFMSRLIHSDANCTLETVGRILFALGVEAGFVEIAQSQFVSNMDSSADQQPSFRQDLADGQKIIKFQTLKSTDQPISQKGQTRASTGWSGSEQFAQAVRSSASARLG